jgi:hypothetical protein
MRNENRDKNNAPLSVKVENLTRTLEDAEDAEENMDFIRLGL